MQRGDVEAGGTRVVDVAGNARRPTYGRRAPRPTPIPARGPRNPSHQSYRTTSGTGLSVVALQRGDELVSPLTAETVLADDTDLLMLGSPEQRAAFSQAFGTDSAIESGSQ